MSRRSLIVATLALTGMAPWNVALAQEPSEAPAGEPFELRLDRGPERVMQFVMNRRARLGLKVNLRARSTDSVGAYVDAVTPSGPAAKAGIQSGDLITKVDGKSVLTSRPSDAQADQQSLPGLRLIELAARLQPNDTIAVEFRRGKERKTVSVVTADEPDIYFQAAPGGPGGRSFAFRQMGPDGPRPMAMPFEDDLEPHLGGPLFLYGSPLARLELAPLNPDLGRYFGATDGVLIVSAPRDSALGLKGGDVVLAVDGRKPATPSHLLRILRSYDKGESFKIDVLRNHKRETLVAKLGEKD
ncbi:MAG TPA: PDZ domain-containing protein [Gemmatimonadales bacterium]|jgi:S1-C subfamily serine protease|nr:PDZ domain-containing protein [Gemmatimonadales bacterium]